MTSKRFELSLADGPNGSCQVLCPLCWNSSTRLMGVESQFQGWTLMMAGGCGHSWALEFTESDDELHVAALSRSVEDGQRH